MNIILASRSIRRKRLLKRIMARFTCIRPVEPKPDFAKAPGRETLRLAKAKAWSVAKKYPHAIVIAADTLLKCREKILGQPRTRTQAQKMIQLVSGHTVLAYTSVCVFSPETKTCWTERASVRFKQVDTTALEHYLSSSRWKGKAGGFNIEDEPLKKWIKKIKGDPNVVIGLPLKRLKNALEKLP